MREPAHVPPRYPIRAVARLTGRLELWVGGALPADLDHTLAGRHIVRRRDFQARF